MRIFEPSSDVTRGRALGNKLEPTAEYKASKADLSASARIALRFLERDIQNDPDHREHRFEMTWPGIGSRGRHGGPGNARCIPSGSRDRSNLAR